MDPDVQLAINEGNEKVEKTITSAFEKALKAAVENIVNHIDLKIVPLEKENTRLAKMIDQLYTLVRGLTDRVGALEQRQSHEEGKDVGEDKADDAHARRYEMSLGKIGLMLTVATVIGGLVAWLIATL